MSKLWHDLKIWTGKLIPGAFSDNKVDHANVKADMTVVRSLQFITYRSIEQELLLHAQYFR